MFATGTNQSHVPFTRIASDPAEFVGRFVMPKGIAFKDPSKYTGVEIAKILFLWRGRQKAGIIPFSFSHVVSKAAIDAAQYAEGLFDGWTWPKSTRLPKTKMSPPTTGNADQIGSTESSDDVQLPRQAWLMDNDTSSTDAEAPEEIAGGAAKTEPPEDVLSPLPTEQLDDVTTPLRTRHATKKIVMSEEEGTPEPTMPIHAPDTSTRRRPQLRIAQLLPLVEESIAAEQESPPKAPRGRPKGKANIPSHTTRHRQLATPGPSDSATPTTSDIGTPIRQLRMPAEATPATEVRKSSRLRKPRKLS